MNDLTKKLGELIDADRLAMYYADACVALAEYDLIARQEPCPYTTVRPALALKPSLRNLS